MIKMRLFLAWMMLLPLTLTAQEEKELPMAQEQADSTVLVVPYEELVVQRLDALVDDTLMETSQLGLMVPL